MDGRKCSQESLPTGPEFLERFACFVSCRVRKVVVYDSCRDSRSCVANVHSAKFHPCHLVQHLNSTRFQQSQHSPGCSGSEQGKAHTSIAFVPRYFFAGTRNGTKVVTCKAAGGAFCTFSGPEGGTSTIEKLQRSIKMKETSTVKLQKELQRHVSQKRSVAPESPLCVDWQRYSKRFQEDIRNIRVLFVFFPDIYL